MILGKKFGRFIEFPALIILCKLEKVQKRTLYTLSHLNNLKFKKGRADKF